MNNKANINSIADLKDKRSCHGGYNSTQGWDIPVGLLLATMTMAPDCRGELYSVSKFFDQSCAPGKFCSYSTFFFCHLIRTVKAGKDGVRGGEEKTRWVRSIEIGSEKIERANFIDHKAVFHRSRPRGAGPHKANL